MKKASFTKCGKFLAVSSSDVAYIYSTEDFSVLSEVKTDGFINDLFLSSDNKVAAVTNKNTFTIFEEGEVKITLNLGDEGMCIDISEDNSTAYLGTLVRTYILIFKHFFLNSAKNVFKFSPL